MSSTNSKTSRIRSRRRIAIAAVAGAAALGIVGTTSPAFASGTPGPAGVLSGTVIVPSTLSIAPSTGSFSITAQPGVTTDVPAFTITTGSSDGSGYSLIEKVQQQFGTLPNTDWATDVWTLTSRGGNGSGNYALTDPAFDTAGDAITLFSTSTDPAQDFLSGLTGLTATSPVPNAHPYSDGNPGTHDIFTSVLHLSLPANQPGSPGDNGYQGSFDYQVIGS